jgi:imidazolonepropionase-like amidohydrolase
VDDSATEEQKKITMSSQQQKSPSNFPPRYLWHSLPPGITSQNRVIKFTNARLYKGNTFKNEDLWVRDGRVIDAAERFWDAASFSEFACDIMIDCEGHVLCPGFIDIQCNGEWKILAHPFLPDEHNQNLSLTMCTNP